MKSHHSVVILALVISASAYADDRPNILFMMSDDQAWNGLSVPMHPELDWSKSATVETPNLARLSSQGMRFSAAYSPASVCSPTRISLQTGRSPAALHWTDVRPGGRAAPSQKMINPVGIRKIDEKEITIGELLRDAGYATAHFGKWHINGGGPAAHGYDESDGDIGNEYADRFHEPNPADIFGMAERATAFMEKSVKAGKPFFIQMSWHALHASPNANQATKEKYAKKLGTTANDRGTWRPAIAENLDTGVGIVVDAIDRLHIADNTFVIYMSDNGGPNGRGRQSEPGLSGGKGSVWEGGIRVPLIIRGPGVSADSWCHQRVVGYDLFPTFCEWAGVDKSNLPDKIEGGSMVNLLDDGEGEVERSRNAMVFHYPHYPRQAGGDGPHSALFLGDYKLLKFYETDRLALYDIKADIREENDLSKEMVEKTAELDALLANHLKEIGAQMATANPQYDPDKPPTASRRGGRRRGRRN